MTFDTKFPNVMMYKSNHHLLLELFTTKKYLSLFDHHDQKHGGFQSCLRFVELRETDSCFVVDLPSFGQCELCLHVCRRRRC